MGNVKGALEGMGLDLEELIDEENDPDLSTQSRSVTFGAKQRCHALVQRMRLTASLYTSERSLFPTEITKTTTFSSITWYTRR